MATRLSREERDTIIRRSAANYRHNAEEIQRAFNRKGEAIASQVHGLFQGGYARKIVWQRLVIEVGEERAQNLRSGNFDSLVRGARDHHENLVHHGLVSRRGLVLNLKTGLAETQSESFNQVVAEMKNVQKEYAYL